MNSAWEVWDDFKYFLFHCICGTNRCHTNKLHNIVCCVSGFLRIDFEISRLRAMQLRVYDRSLRDSANYNL